MNTKLTVNGEERSVGASPMTDLASVLREELALTGTKLVCGEGFCGACLVEVDGETVPACLVPVGLVEGHDVWTIESVAPPGEPLSTVQQALKDNDAVQCGMCFPGMVMSLTGLLRVNPDPTADNIRAHLSGNICRCTGYERIVEAALAAAAAQQTVFAPRNEAS
ncbi:(2Fe-2S)-binding protein [Streptomyces tubercidicus]|uniref:(2Fe-2S)-binding protein n=1 Tax=Streptomyces tubercidicus TaxID=47759 RepID=UPI003467E061